MSESPDLCMWCHRVAATVAVVDCRWPPKLADLDLCMACLEEFWQVQGLGPDDPRPPIHDAGWPKRGKAHVCDLPADYDPASPQMILSLFANSI